MCAVVSTISVELQKSGRNDAGTGTFGRPHKAVYRWVQAYAPEIEKRCSRILESTPSLRDATRTGNSKFKIINSNILDEWH
jgi:hypothetical protein